MSNIRLESKGIVQLALAAWFFYALGKWLNSSSLQLLGLGFVAVAWLVSIFGWSRSSGLILLIGLICLPQGLINEKVLLVLQRLATTMASWALDVVRIVHVPQGAVLETMRGDLFVENACSGMQSLLTGMVVAQIYFAWFRKGFLFSVMGLIGVGFLLLLGNSLRIFIIAFMYVRYDIDWMTGWSHDMTGTVVYLGVLSLLPSLCALLSGIEIIWNRIIWGYLKQQYPWIVEETHAFTEDFDLGRNPINLELVWRLPVSLMPTTVCWVVVGMMTVGVMEFVVYFESRSAREMISLKCGQKLMGVEIPKEIAGWRHDPENQEVSFIEKLSLNQHVWCFRNGDLTAWVAADLPYDQIHPLRDCYQNRNWHVVKEGNFTRLPVSPFAFMELRSKEITRAPMLVLFDNYDLSKKRYVGSPTRLGRRLEMMSERLNGTKRQSGPFCLVQVVIPRTQTVESPSGFEAAQLLVAIRDVFVERLSNHGPL